MHPSKESFLLAIARIEKFSPAPLILARARRMLHEPDSDLADIATLIERDPALAADVIRCANSAFFGNGEPVQSVLSAVQRIGLRETVGRLNLTVTRLATARDLGSYGMAAEDYWAESLFHGLFLRRLAAQTGWADTDEAYITGLLRFIGRLAINQAIHDLGGGLFWFGDQPISEWETESTGFTQATAGALLLAKWQFPVATVQAVGAQDAPATLDNANWLAEALYFAGALLPAGLGGSFQLSLAESAPAAPLGSDFMHRYGLTPDDVTRLLEETKADYDRIRQEIS